MQRARAVQRDVWSYLNEASKASGASDRPREDAMAYPMIGDLHSGPHGGGVLHLDEEDETNTASGSSSREVDIEPSSTSNTAQAVSDPA